MSAESANSEYPCKYDSEKAEEVVRFLRTIGYSDLAREVQAAIGAEKHWREQAAAYLAACERYQEALS